MDWSVFRSTSGSINNKKAEIVAKIREGISSGELMPGQRLTGATKLGRAFGCSGSPVAGARRQLVNEGLIVQRDGHYFVAGVASPTEEGEHTETAMDVVNRKLDAAFDDLLNEN